MGMCNVLSPLLGFQCGGNLPAHKKGRHGVVMMVFHGENFAAFFKSHENNFS
jgi:hypothetical protein